MSQTTRQRGDTQQTEDEPARETCPECNESIETQHDERVCSECGLIGATQRVYIATEIASAAAHYHTRRCQTLTDSTVTEISIHTARANALTKCRVCDGTAIRKGLAGDLAAMTPSEAGL